MNVTVIRVERWCPKCEKIFESTRKVERVGRESTARESPCPTCGTQGTVLLQR